MAGNSDRYQREIEEILEQVNEAPPPPGRPIRVARRSAPSPPISNRGGFALTDVFTSGRLLVGGLALIIIGFFTLDVLIWGGLACLVLAYIVFFVKPRSPIEKRWRGQPIEDQRSSSRLRRWFNRK